MSCALTRNRNDLFNQYSCLFHPSNNRNAASHVWVNHLVNHSSNLSVDEFREQAKGFCPVSGSPISGSNEFVQDLSTTLGTQSRVAINYCCWPCTCDISDANAQNKLHIHPSVVNTAGGSLNVNYIVIDDPCNSSANIPIEAPAIQCNGNSLQNAIHVQTPIGSKVAIGFAFDSQELPNYPSTQCENRANNNYRSGMGMIFRNLLSLTPN